MTVVSGTYLVGNEKIVCKTGWLERSGLIIFKEKIQIFVPV